MGEFSRFAFRFLRGFLAAILVVFVILAGAIAYFGYTRHGNQVLASLVAEQVSTPDLQVSLEGAEGLLKGDFKLDRVRLADTRGEFAEINGLRLIWTPSDLFSFRFHADRLEAASVRFDRLPVKTVESEPSNSEFTLPVEIAVDSLSLPNVTLGEALAGRETVVALEGSAQAAADRVAAKLSAREQSQPEAEANADLSYSLAEETLRIVGSVKEPQGGLLATLLKLPGEPPVEIAVDGDGRIEDWSGKITGKVNDRDVLLLSGSHRLAEPGIHQVALNGGGFISELLPPALRGYFAGETKIDVNTRIGENGLLQINSGTIANDSLKLEASGELDPEGNARLSASLLPAGERLLVTVPQDKGNLEAALTGARLEMTGPYRRAKIDLRAELSTVTSPDIQANNIAATVTSEGFDLAERAGRLALRIAAVELEPTDATVGKIIEGPMRFGASIDVAAGRIALTDGTLESARLGGALTAHYQPADERAAADFSLHLLPQGLLPPEIEAKISGTIGLSGHLDAALPGRFSLENLRLTSNIASLNGTVQLDGQALNARLAGEVPDLLAFQNEAAGQATLSLDASGPLSMPNVSLKIGSQEVRIAGRALANLQAAFDGVADAKAPSGKLTLSFSHQNEVINASADIGMQDGRLAIPALKTEIGANLVSGALAFDNAFKPSGTIDIDIADLPRLAALAGQTAEGSLKGTVKLATAEGRTTADIDLAGPRLAASGAEIIDPAIRITSPDIATGAFTGRLTGKQIGYGDNRVDRPDLDFALQGGRTSFNLAGLFDEKPLTLQGSVTPRTDGATAIELSSFEAEPRGIPVRLSAPSDIVISNGTATIEGLLLSAGDGQIAVSGSAGETLSLLVDVNALPAALANSFVKDLGATGTLDANIVVGGTATSPEVDYHATGSRLATSQTRNAGLPPLELSLDGRFANKVVTLDLKGDPQSADSEMPLISAATEVRLGEGQIELPTISAAIAGNNLTGQLTFGSDGLPTGQIAFDFPSLDNLAKATGRTAEGAVKGRIDLASATGKLTAKVDADGALRGQAIKALIDATVEGGAVSLPSLQINVGANKVTGNVALNAEMQPSGKIEFDLPDLALLAAMAGQTAEGALKGTAEISTEDARISAVVDATGEIRGQAIDIDTTVTAENGLVTLPALTARIGANTLSGSFALNDDFLPVGQLSFDLPDIGLIAAMAGQEAEGALKGKAELRPDNGRITGVITATGDQLTASGTRIAAPNVDLTISDLAAGRISGTVRATEIAVGANKLEQLALNVAVEGDETRFDLDGRLDGAPLNGAGSLASREDGMRLAIDSFSAAPRGIPLTLANPAEIRIVNGTAHIDQLTIKAADGTISVNGEAGQNLNLAIAARDLPLVLANNVDPALDAAGTLSADVTVAGTSAAPLVSFKANATGIETVQTRNAKLGTLDLTAEGKLADNVLDTVAKTAIRGEPVELAARLNLAGGAIELPTFRLATAGAEVSGNIRLENARPSGSISFDVPDAEKIAALFGQKAEGAIRGKADISSEGEKIAARVTATGRLREQDIGLTADVAQDAGAVSVPALKLEIGRNVLTGMLALDPAMQPSGKFDFDFPDMGLVAALAGQKAEGALKGKAELSSADGKLTTTVDATGAVRGQAVAIAGQAVMENGAVSLPRLKVDVGRNTLSGAITLDESYLPNGRLEFDFPEIALLAALAGQDAAGDLKGVADIRSQNGTVRGTIKAQGAKVSAAGASVAKPAIDLSIADLATGQINGTVAAAEIVSGANRIGNLTLAFDRAGDATNFDLGARYDGAPLSAKGKLTQQADGMLLALSSFSAQPRKIAVRLEQPTEIAIRNGAVALDNLRIRTGDGAITVSGKAGETLDLVVKANALPASLANAFASDLDASGTITADVNVKGQAANPTVGFNVDWRNAQVAQTRAAGLSAFTIGAKGQLADNVLTINANANGGQGLTVAANGTVGLANQSLSLKVNGRLPFAAIGAQLAESGVALDGNAAFDLSIGGSTTNPAITGQVTTSGATLTVVRQNLTIRNLAATINLDGKQARITSLTGKLAAGGTVSVSGTVGITPNSGFPADLKIQLRNAVYTDGRVVAAKLGGDLGITGQLTGSPVLNGRIRLSRADITIPEKLPGSLAQVDVKHRNAPRDVQQQAAELKKNRPGEETGSEKSGIALDLRISAPRQIFVRGRGLDAELGGDVTVTGTANAPVVSGGFRMLRGRLAIIGRRLDFSSGNITFGGDMMPSLDLVATSTVEATTINVTVSGPANDPNVAFTSNPGLPQDEVLALLIFGRSSADLSPVQIAQLADAVATLAGGQSNSLFNRLRQGLGVDDLDVGTDENGKSNVSAGKYLNKRTYLQFQQGVETGTSKAIINLDIGKGVKLKTEAGSDGSAATGIFFEKEY